MTTQEKKSTPRVRAKVTTTETPVAKETTATKPRRPRAAKPKPPVKEEAKAPVVETKPESTDDLETVIKAEQHSDVVITEADAIAEAVENIKTPEQSSEVSYTIGVASYDIRAVNGNADGKYPLGVWVRDTKTLVGLQAAALQRMADDEATGNDYTTVDYADQNSVNLDTHMANFFNRPNARWNNYLPVGDRKLRNSSANYRPGSIAGNSDRVVAALMRKFEIGNPLIVRLWASGIVFSINPPDKAERIAMVERLNSAHLETLRRTNGLIHGTSSYYANRIIINEFMKHVTAANIDKSLWNDVFELMDHRDIQMMAAGIMGASHLRGYKLVETCGGLKEVKDASGNPILREDGSIKKTICGHINTDIIDFKLLNVIDDNMFTDWQREIMARPLDENNPLQREDIIKYQSEGAMHKEDNIVIDDELTVIIKAPNAGLHIEIGEEWITSVEDALNDVISVEADEETKNDYINRQLEATASLDVAHWVKGFNYGGELITDRAGINRIFRALGNNSTLRDELFNKIRAGMVSRLPAVVAVPTFKCEGCGNLSNVIQNNGTAFYTPIDMVSRFFILTARSQ